MWKIQLFVFVEALLLTMAAITILAGNISRIVLIVVLCLLLLYYYIGKQRSNFLLVASSILLFFIVMLNPYVIAALLFAVVYAMLGAYPYFYRENEEVKKKIVDLVGKEAYQNDALNKALLAKFLLASPQNATALNEIVHPAVAKDFENSGLEWIESAILYDSAFDKRIDIDFVVCVSAPLETRISRIMQRDNITREAALQWITKQLNQDEVIAKADFELVNDGIKDVEIQLNEILSKIQE